MTDRVEEPVPLGRRLESVARARLGAYAVQPRWADPLAVAMRHLEHVAEAHGRTFERVELDAPPAGEMGEVGVDTAHTAFLPAPASRGADRTVGHGWETEGGREPGAGPAGADDPADEVREVPADVRSRVRRAVGPGADLMRVHTGPRAHARARAADADAVTEGRDVHLRQGRWAPHRLEGEALLVHEATHVAGLVDPGEAWRRAVGGSAEEALARARERAVLEGAGAPGRVRPGDATGPVGRASLPAPPPGRPSPTAGPTSGPSAGPSSGAAPGSGLRAGTERDLTPAPAGPDLDALRRDVVAEVMGRLRSEIERGA